MLTGYLSRRKALSFSDYGLLLLVGDCHIRQRVLCKKSFGWMALWGLNPEVLWLLWLMASATWGKITSAEGLHGWGRRAVPFFNYTLAFALKLRETTENLSQGSRVIGDYLLRRLGWQPWLACWTSVHLGYPWVTSVSPWSPRVPSKLPK
jgi:hypothetical protein